MKIVPNFHFRGQCKQALELYKQAFDAEVKLLLCNNEVEDEDQSKCSPFVFAGFV